MNLAQRWLTAAYQGSAWLTLLRPLSGLYQWCVQRRRAQYGGGRLVRHGIEVPVIVVGNITLGGTGKSPLVAWVVRTLERRGHRPGIVARGYGGKAPAYPLTVSCSTPVAHCGDEPLMLARQTGCPVVVDPDRVRAARALVAQGCSIIVSDDGLQHLSLARDLEIVVVDGIRGLGNGRCLPEGPLREPPERLHDVDAVVINQPEGAMLSVPAWTMQTVPSGWRHLHCHERYPLWPLPFRSPVNAMAAIGHPARFFTTLQRLGVEVDEHPFPDHWHFDEASLEFAHLTPKRPLIMTAKDAVKCESLAPMDAWVLDIEAQPSQAFVSWFEDRLTSLRIRSHHG